ncbi:xanthine dehydrogenase small subunit [Pantoea sp. FN060301]|uniref:xanthine dehydrogenase small subunit n=1 Tax=Pantoea sp. FN060301 TaxID=3420380 RepID=UPI003D162DFA
MIQFLLNQTLVSEENIDPNLTVLNYLRRNQRRSGTKEGCASGDCGACTVTLGRAEQGRMVYETVNSCITFVSALQGKQLITVEDLKENDRLHSVQQAMVDCHASQCGFCTPGFVMSLFTLQKNTGGWQHKQAEQALAGNLCRCTGYRPIVAAARQACEQQEEDSFSRQEASTVSRLEALTATGDEEISANGNRCLLPITTEQLATLYAANPKARLLAGGTDLALRVTQQAEALPLTIALDRIAELKRCYQQGDEIVLGAGASLSHCYEVLAARIPAVAQMLTRFASQQIRNQGTLGGNIGNASPVGDTPPMLLALDASLMLQQEGRIRRLPLADFFLSYRKTALREGEFIRTVRVPEVTGSQFFRAWKVAKRAEDDISAVLGAFMIETDEAGNVCRARLAFGGMAAIPMRAVRCEQLLTGKPFTTESLELACAMLEHEFAPVSDFRASAGYRLLVAKNLLRRYHASFTGELNLLEVSDYVS